MTPIVVVKSGMVTTCDSNPTSIVPEKMPASATPIGRPIASTEPNAMMRMMIAKPTPSASEDGTSNWANAPPPSSIRSPSSCGIAARMSSPMRTVSSNDASDFASNSAYAIRPSLEICPSLPGAYGLRSDCTPGTLATWAR